MYLNASNVADYLTGVGLLSPESLVGGDVRIVDAGRRNRNFNVRVGSGPASAGLFLKQIKTAEPQAVATIYREAAVYSVVHSSPQFVHMASLTPRFRVYDAERHALVIEGFADGESLAERQSRTGRSDPALAADLGRALAIVHAHGAFAATDGRLAMVLPRQVPWPLMLDLLGADVFAQYGSVGARLLMRIHNVPGLVAALAGLRRQWTADALIHGDMKWDNCLLCSDSGGGTYLRLVDWELADIGDGAWDVASVFRDFLMIAIVRPPLGSSPDPATARAAARAFWQAYEETRGLTALERSTFRDRAVRFTAGRMITALLEYLIAGPGFAEYESPMLQMAVSLLAHGPLVIADLIGEG